MITNAIKPGFFQTLLFLFSLALFTLGAGGCGQDQSKQGTQQSETAKTDAVQAESEPAAEKATTEATEASEQSSDDSKVSETDAKTSESESAEPAQTDESQPTGEKMSANPIVKLETSKGTMTIELDAEKAPNTVANFVDYVKDGFYDGLIFHRVIPNFMVQGGGMLPDMSEKSNKSPIKNEANNGLKNDRGTLAMARTNDPHSATSQFFINLKDNDFLNFSSETPAGWGYAVFGKVTDGLEVIDEIAKVKTGNHGYHGDVPLEPVLINKATVE